MDPRLTGDLSPVALARLSVQLPEKYPGQDLVFLAKGAAASARVGILNIGTRWPVEAGVLVERTGSYRSADKLSRSAQSATFSVGRTW